MSFSDAQIRALQRNVPSRNLRSRVRDGKELTYVEGWYAIHVANCIFGFDGWDRETLETRCVVAREVGGSYSAVYAARVRVAVRVGERVVIRDGHGTGEGRGGAVGEVHDLALKAAETDATKRALATFGKAFGLSLYANTKAKPRNGSLATAATTGQRTASTNSNGELAADYPNEVNQNRSDEAAGLENERSLASPSEEPRMGRSETPSSRFTNRQIASTRPQVPIDKSALHLPEPRRIHDRVHLRYVSTQPCLLCSQRPSDAHHLKFAQPRALGRKVSDRFTVPLCRTHHRQLHQTGNEVSWWHDMGIDPIPIAEQLWNDTASAQGRV